jgi:predicted ATP-grasp superfamily ATP-dependent carboligase
LIEFRTRASRLEVSADPFVREVPAAPPRVLVTEGEERATLAACRCMSTAGYRVSVVAAKRFAVSHWSRFCQERLLFADPVHDPTAFLDGLEHVLRAGTYSVLLPGSDAALMAISSERERLAPYAELGLPSRAAVEASLDKFRLVELAEVAGFATPRTVICEGIDEATSAARQLGFPLVLKSRRSIIDNGYGLCQPNTCVVSDQAQLSELAPRYGNPFLLQAREWGVAYSCGGVITEDGLLAMVTSRYLRTWPPDAGNVACSQIVEAPAGLAECVETMLRMLGWHGLFELELIRRADGSFVPIDLNPRVYGSLAAAVAAGVPLPAIWCDWLLGRRPARARPRPGVMYRWEDAELRHLLWQLRRGHLRQAVAVLRPHRGVVHAHFNVSDPGPIVARALALAGVARRRHVGRKGRPRPQSARRRSRS